MGDGKKKREGESERQSSVNCFICAFLQRENERGDEGGRSLIFPFPRKKKKKRRSDKIESGRSVGWGKEGERDGRQDGGTMGGRASFVGELGVERGEEKGGRGKTNDEVWGGLIPCLRCQFSGFPSLYPVVFIRYSSYQRARKNKGPHVKF